MRQFLLLIFILGIFGFVSKTITGELVDDLSTAQPPENDTTPVELSKVDSRYTENDVSKNYTVKSEAEHKTEHDAPKNLDWERFWEWRYWIIISLLFCVCMVCILCLGLDSLLNACGNQIQIERNPPVPENGNNPPHGMDPEPVGDDVFELHEQNRPHSDRQEPGEKAQKSQLVFTRLDEPPAHEHNLKSGSKNVVIQQTIPV